MTTLRYKRWCTPNIWIKKIKRTLEDLIEAKQRIEIHNDDPDNDATDKAMTWMKQRQQVWQDWQVQRKEDKACQALTILNIAKIRVKNDMTVMVSNLPSGQKLHGEIGDKRNIRDMKRVRTKHALSNNRKRGTMYEQCNGDKKGTKQNDE
jgi:hypothetical protein